MRKTLKVVAFGGGPADAFIKAAGITDSTQQTAIKTLVNDLNGYGLWSKMKAIYPMVGGNATAHSYNLKDTTKFQIAFSGGWTHSSNGILPNGTNGYADTKVNLSITLTNNNYHLSHYSRTQSTTGTQVDMASVGNPPEMIGLTQYYGGISAKSFLCGDYNTNNIAFNDTNTLGLMVGSRTSQTSAKMFMNNVQRGSTLTANNPNALPNRIIFLAANNSAGGIIEYSSRQCAFATIGEGLSDTEASNLYTSIQKFQTTLNRFVGTPIYSSFDSDAQSFMTSASITDSTQQAAVNYLVTDLKANSLWDKMKAVYPMVGGSATSHSYNLKNPSQFQITWNGGLTHSSNGVLPNGSNGYGNTNFIDNSTQLNNTSRHLSFYSRTQNSSINAHDIGAENTSIPSFFNLFTYYASVSYKGFIDGGYPANAAQNNNTNTIGFQIGTRTDNNVQKLFWNNSLLNTNTTIKTVSQTSLNVYIGCTNANGTASAFSNRQCAFSSIGDGLTDTEASNLYTIVQNYQTILSRQV